MKNSVLSLLFILFTVMVFGQCPTTDIVLTTQSDVDNFMDNYPGCTALTHELKIDGNANTITNLNGLSSVVSGEKLFIINTEISDFSGLENLVNIEHLAIWFNANIQDMSGFDALQSSGFLEVYVNPNLTSLIGMPNLSSLDNASIFQNTSLNDIAQLSFINTITNLEIWANGLNNLSGLENLQTVEGYLKITDEPLLTNFNELASLEAIDGSLYLIDNLQAVDFSSFSDLTVLDELYIINCSGMTDLTGFSGLQTVTGTLRIGYNSGLIDLAGLDGLSLVENFDIYHNENFLSLKGIENLDFIGQRLFIDSNEALLSIETLRYASASMVDEVVVINNTLLPFCRNDFICDIISDPSVSKTFFNNQSDCNSVGEVEATCNLPLPDLTYANLVEVYPNPVSGNLTINVPEEAIVERSVLSSTSGEQLFFDNNINIDLSGVPAGIYFLTIHTSKGSTVKKIIKN